MASHDVSHGTYFPKVQTDAIELGGTAIDTSLTTGALTTSTLTADSLALNGKTFDKLVKVASVSLTGNAIHGGVQAWQNTESGSILIIRAILDVTTKSTGASTINVGTTATNATTASDNLIDGLDSGTAAGTFDNVSDVGTNGKSRQKLATGKWVTVSEASGDTSGAATTLYLFYLAL